MKSKLYYHKDPNGNFGDDLNPWLWTKIIPGIYDGYCYHDPSSRTEDMISDNYIVGIGTLLNKHVPVTPKKIVLGTGTGYGQPAVLDASWIVYAVRGPLTAKVLGLDESFSVTDGAILTANLGLLKKTIKHPISFMPHISAARGSFWSEVCEDMNINYIDPQGDVETVLAQLLETGVLVTEAMHGAILADTLRIPWVSVSTSDKILNFKWNDWCNSMGLEHSFYNLPSLWKNENRNTLKQKTIDYVKFKIAKNTLTNVIKKMKPITSNEKLFNLKLEEMNYRIDLFKKDYSSNNLFGYRK